MQILNEVVNFATIAPMLAFLPVVATLMIATAVSDRIA
jgi:hypothetical protein